MKKIIILLTLFLSLTSLASAEKRYVTDRILLGIHVEADEASALIKSVPSGTELDVIDTAEGFVKVKLEDGTVGWASTGFVMEQPPASRKYDVLAHEYEQTTQELDKLKIDYAKKDRELEVRRDQLSNATTTIRELKKRKGGGEVVVDEETEDKLAASLKEIETLKIKIAELEKAPEPVVNVDQKQIFNELKEAKEQNDVMKKRIDVALAHLNGERIPTAEELASIRPKFPLWYWTLLMIILLVGVVAGYFIMDYRFRSRHGGFRI
jgi:SH3 domain protein